MRIHGVATHSALILAGRRLTRPRIRPGGPQTTDSMRSTDANGHRAAATSPAPSLGRALATCIRGGRAVLPALWRANANPGRHHGCRHGTAHPRMPGSPDACPACDASAGFARGDARRAAGQARSCAGRLRVRPESAASLGRRRLIAAPRRRTLSSTSPNRPARRTCTSRRERRGPEGDRSVPCDRESLKSPRSGRSPSAAYLS